MSGIAPPALRIEHHMAMLVMALPDTSQFLNASVTRAQNRGRQRLRSRRPFSRHAKSLATSNLNLLEEWQHDWQETTKPTQFAILPGITIPLPPGADLPRRRWVTLNRLRSGVSRIRANVYHILLERSKLRSLLGSHTNLTNPCPELWNGCGTFTT